MSEDGPALEKTCWQQSCGLSEKWPRQELPIDLQQFMAMSGAGAGTAH